MREKWGRRVAAMVGAVALAGVVFAADQLVTVELRSGERLAGTLVGLKGGVYTLKIGEKTRELKEAEVRRIDFGETREGPPKDAVKVDLEVDDKPIAEVMADLGERLGKPIFVDKDITEKVTVSLRQIPARDAIDVIARMTRCEVNPYGDGSLLVHQPPRVTVQFTKANLRVVLSLLSAYSGRNLIAAPDVKDAVTIDMKEVTWLRAVEALVRVNKLSATRKGDLLVVSEKAIPWGSSELDHVETGRWPGPAETGDAPPLELDGKEASLTELCDAVGRKVGRNILVAPREDEPRLALKVKKAPWRDVVMFLGRASRSHVDVRPGGVVVLEAVEPVTVQTQDCPIDALLQFFASKAGKNVVLSSDVAGHVSLDLKELVWDDALKAVAFAHGFPVQADGHDLYRIGAGGAKGGKAPADVAARLQEIQLGKNKVRVALQALIVNEKKPADSRVILGGTIYSAGDVVEAPGSFGSKGRTQIGGVKVKKIESTGVTLEDADHAEAHVAFPPPG